MRELNNIKIIAVDHGYGNIKTANTVTPTGVTAYETEPIFSGNILEYGGIYYRIGEGHKEFIADKAMDEDYYILTLMAVARELNVYGIREADVHLAAGLPLTWIRKQREDFRSYLLRNKEVYFRFNSKDYRIRFVGCSLFPQGYPAIVSRYRNDIPTNIAIQPWLTEDGSLPYAGRIRRGTENSATETGATAQVPTRTQAEPPPKKAERQRTLTKSAGVHRKNALPLFNCVTATKSFCVWFRKD